MYNVFYNTILLFYGDNIKKTVCFTSNYCKFSVKMLPCVCMIHVAMLFLVFYKGYKHEHKNSVIKAQYTFFSQKCRITFNILTAERKVRIDNFAANSIYIHTGKEKK